MHRIVRLLPRRQMASRCSTRRRRNVQRVVPIDVARSARNVCVPIRQRKTKCCVIEFSVRPGGNGMAGGALGRGTRESGGDVIRNVATEGGGAVPGGEVAAHTVGGTQRVVVVDVARCAGSRRRRHVRSCQRKARDTVVERSCIPTFRRVAIRAIR